MEIDAKGFDRIAREVFAPAYSLIASQIKEKTGIHRGYCLDVGCGGGYLGLALARITDLYVYLLDKSQEMLEIAQENIIDQGLRGRAEAVPGDVHQLPFPEASVDLVISRGSIFFWDNLEKAFREIYRVLAPGGMTYIGGGFGNKELKEKIWREMCRRDPEWPHNVKKRWEKVGEFQEKLKLAKINGYEIFQGEAGLWILMKKGKN